jgi:hypothetical protein
MNYLLVQALCRYGSARYGAAPWAVRDDSVSAVRHYFDLATMLRQIGVAG